MDLATVDLEALGLAPVVPVRAPRRTAGGSGRRTPAAAPLRDQFESLMGAIGMRPQGRREEFHRCPWHNEAEASLHVDWEAAIFWCFGCCPLPASRS